MVESIFFLGGCKFFLSNVLPQRMLNENEALNAFILLVDLQFCQFFSFF